MAIPVILRGDTSAAITFRLADGYDYEGIWLDIEVFEKRVTMEMPSAGASIALKFTAEDTENVALGTHKIRFSVRNAAGDKKSLPWAKVKVTDSPDEIASPVLELDPSTIEGIDTTDADSLGDVKKKLNKLLSILRGGAISLALFALPALADLKPDTPLNDIPGNATISNIVQAAGVASGAVPENVATKDDVAKAVQDEQERAEDAEATLTEAISLKAAKSEVAAIDAKAADALNLANAVSTIVLGDDCQLVSTNYNSATKMPFLFLRFKIKDESTGDMVWYKVWDEMTRWNHLFEEYLPTNYFTKTEVTAELDQKADRAWGFYDSHTGNYAPDGYTWISSPKIAIAGGLSYQRVATTEGAVFVLCSNGLVTEIGGDVASTNGFFRISDDKGNAIFEITKGNEVLAGATANALRQESNGGTTHLYITYNVESSEHPKLQIARELKLHGATEWIAEDSENCPANVIWSGSSGAWVAEVYGKQPEKSLFVQGTSKKGAKDVIRHVAPMEFSEVVIGGVTYKAKVETMNSKKVLVLE